MKNLKTYWSVRTAVIGGNPKYLLFKNYTLAKCESLKEYRDNPVKHTVKEVTYNALEKMGAFED